jgi:hypothetical protein
MNTTSLKHYVNQFYLIDLNCEYQMLMMYKVNLECLQNIVTLDVWQLMLGGCLSF